MELQVEKGFGYKQSGFEIVEWDSKKYCQVHCHNIFWDSSSMPSLEEIVEVLDSKGYKVNASQLAQLSILFLTTNTSMVEDKRISEIRSKIDGLKKSERLIFGLENWKCNGIYMKGLFPNMAANQSSRFETLYYRIENGVKIPCDDSKEFKEVLINALESTI